MAAARYRKQPAISVFISILVIGIAAENTLPLLDDDVDDTDDVVDEVDDDDDDDDDDGMRDISVTSSPTKALSFDLAFLAAVLSEHTLQAYLNADHIVGG
jgi:hypothetical protein